jgi:hypothetical protein
MTIVLDYGQVQSAKKMADGSYRIFARIAVADRAMIYLNPDGSTRKEQISRKELFDPRSTDSLKIQTITHPHSTEDLTPDTYQKFAAGSTGNLVLAGVDGDFLDVVGALRRRDAIDAYEAGIREMSPGYIRKLMEADGKLWQTNRDYFEVALVDRARGGADVRIKDGVDDYARFDPAQIDAQWINYWASESIGLNQDSIDRLLLSGTLSPPPLIIPEKITIKDKKMEPILFTIGGVQLRIDPSCVDAASKLKTEFDRNQQVVETHEKSTRDAIATEVALKSAQDEVKAIQSQLEAAKFAVKDGVGKAVRELQAASADIQMFAATGVDITAAKTCLDAGDLDGYKTAIVKSKFPDKVIDSTTLPVYYECFQADAAEKVKDMGGNPFGQTMMGGYGSSPQPGLQQPFVMPTQLQQIMGMTPNYGTAINLMNSENNGFNGEQQIMAGIGGYGHGLPPESDKWRSA